jgi:hypothetical protein
MLTTSASCAAAMRPRTIELDKIAIHASNPTGHSALCLTRASARVPPMSGQQRTRRDDLSPCPRCSAAQMVEIVTIAPLLHEPGLIAYECAACGYVTSVIIPPADT